MSVLRITKAQGARFVEIIAAACPARALLAGQIGLVEVPRGEQFPAELHRPTPKPVLAIVGDDDHASTGPAGFPAAKPLAAWARAAIIHGAGAEPKHYAEAFRCALTVRHAVLVETDAAHIGDWTRIFGDGQRMPVLEILPRHGVHPG
jgi:hypothetical protein